MTTQAAEGAPAPAAPNTPATPPAGATGTQGTSPAVPQPADESQPWFKERLARAEQQGEQKAREKLLADLGVSDPEKAKAAIAAAKAAEEANKTAEQKRVEAEQRAATAEERVTALTSTVANVAAARMAALSDEHRAVIADITDDPEEQVLLIEKLAPTWKAAPATGGAPAATTPPANTAPPPNAPSGAPNQSPPDRKAEYARLKQTNPHAAAQYLNRYAGEIYPRA